MRAEVSSFYHEPSGSITYVVAEPGGRACAIVDSVLDFEPNAGRIGTTFADGILAHVRARGLEVVWHLETHAHADHFSAAPYLKERLGGRIAIGAAVTRVQRLWKEIYNYGDDFPTDGSQFDHLFADGDRLAIGALEGHLFDTPGHTPANVVYVLGDAAFVNDTILMPDFGTARCDFPGGSARQLYRSIQRILALPDETRLFVGHDYGPNGREPAWEATVAEQKRGNIHLVAHPDEAGFVAMREARDRTLPMPALILHSLQVNIRAGRLPEPESNGVRYLKIPLDRL
jgi:glyoxylase-like metal-dependent hydrolase (beta-lactamase superfamily II)